MPNNKRTSPFDTDSKKTTIFMAHQTPVNTKETYSEIRSKLNDAWGSERTHIEVHDAESGFPLLLAVTRIEKVQVADWY